METVRIRFEPEGAEVFVPPGTTVHEAASEAGVLLEAPCGGLGRCGACRVRIEGDLAPLGATEQEALSPADLAAGVRLACLARIAGPVTVLRHGAPGVMPSDLAIVSVPAVAPGRTGLGAAIDLGTTSIAVSIYDLADGASLGTASALNPQTVFGHDVMTRVSRAQAGDAEALRKMAAAEAGRLIAGVVERASASQGDLVEAVVVGNPTMIHLLLGLDVAPLASAPHEGALVEPRDMAAADAGLEGMIGMRVHVGPAISAFVGSDTVAGIVATRMDARAYPTLFLDLGTNGELVLRSGDAMWATSAAAGPAFEGVSISDGMRAETGAIERVARENGDLRVATVGGAAARGLCGTGLLDAVAVLLDAGTLDSDGRMFAAGPLARRVSTTEAGVRFELAEGVHLTQKDVRQLQLAKGAVAAATGTLLDEAGLAEDEVREVLISGGFGSHLRPASLARLGVVPAGWTDRITFCGNTALAGAAAMLLDPGLRETAAGLARSVRTIALATHVGFERRFLAALSF